MRPFFRIDADSWGLADVYNIRRLSAVLLVVVVGSLSPSGFIKHMGGPMDKLLTQLASGCLLHSILDSLFHILVDFLFSSSTSLFCYFFPPLLCFYPLRLIFRFDLPIFYFLPLL